MRLAWLVVFATASVPVAARAQSAPAADVEVAYEQQALGVRHLVDPLRDGTTEDAQGQPTYNGKWDAFGGLEHRPLDEAAFFRIVGRDDLAHRYVRKERIKKGVTAGGGTLLVGGLIFAALAELSTGAQGAVACPSSATGCGSQSSQWVSPTWGLATASAGLVALIVGHLLDPTPIGPDEADRLARDYDQSLRDRLGISETARRD
jgi:hypothetical protein